MEFVRPDEVLKTLLVVINDRTGTLTGSEEQEFNALVKALCIQNTTSITINLRGINARYLVGKGQFNAIREALVASQAKQVIFNIDLGARHQRVLENDLGVPVFDRTSIILNIFAQRARTYEGKLQVEMAQLEYSSSRLVRGWTHLERQRSGIGQRGGPGEKQLEIDRRLLRVRVRQIEARLDKIKKQRILSRNARKKARLPTVSLVGYTNAGKSTLFNALTGSSAYSSAQLFATLDPTIRKVRGKYYDFLLADTVGFIESLSRSLIKSFTATLGEIKESDLILHIVDISDSKADEKIMAVNSILKTLGASNIPILMVYNKIDMAKELHPKESHHGATYDQLNNPSAVWISADKGIGLNVLLDSINILLEQEVPVASFS